MSENPPYGYFYHLNDPFCEGRELGLTSTSDGHKAITEIGNTISNIFYLFVSAWCFRMVHRTDSLTRVCCALTMCTGLGSILYHSTMWMGMGIFDGTSLHLLVSYIALALVEDIITTTIDENTNLFTGIMSTIQVLFSMFMIYVIQRKTILDDGSPGDIVFLSVPITIIILSCITWIILLQYTQFWKQNRESSTNAQILIILAAASMMIGYMFQVIDQRKCGPEVVYIFGHVIWHILSAYAICCLIILMTFLRGSMYGYESSIRWFGPLPLAILNNKDE